MNKNTIFKLTNAGFIFALFLLVSQSFLTRVHGQTSTPPVAQQNAVATSDFQHDVEEGKQQVNNDKDAQNNQHEIDNEEDEKGGDEHGDRQAIDGEKPEQEIDQEIETEVDEEGDQGSHQSDENGDAASSTDNETDGSDESASSTVGD